MANHEATEAKAAAHSPSTTEEPRQTTKDEPASETVENVKKTPLLEKVKVISNAVAALLIPIILSIIGLIVNSSIKSAEVSVSYVEIATEILRQKKDSVQPNLRKWAVDVINEYSDVKLSEEAREELQDKGLPEELFMKALTGNDYPRPEPVLLEGTSSPIEVSIVNSDGHQYLSMLEILQDGKPVHHVGGKTLKIDFDDLYRGTDNFFQAAIDIRKISRSKGYSFKLLFKQGGREIASRQIDGNFEGESKKVAPVVGITIAKSSLNYSPSPQPSPHATKAKQKAFIKNALQRIKSWESDKSDMACDFSERNIGSLFQILGAQESRTLLINFGLTLPPGVEDLSTRLDYEVPFRGIVSCDYDDEKTVDFLLEVIDILKGDQEITELEEDFSAGY